MRFILFSNLRVNRNWLQNMYQDNQISKLYIVPHELSCKINVGLYQMSCSGRLLIQYETSCTKDARVCTTVIKNTPRLHMLLKSSLLNASKKLNYF